MNINSKSSYSNPNEHRNHKTRGFDYNSAIWKAKRLTILIRDKFQCQYCKAKGILTKAWGVDHTIPINQGGDPLADTNLKSICKPCHDSKSSNERIKK